MGKEVVIVLELPLANPAVIPAKNGVSINLLLVYFHGLGPGSTISISRRITSLPSTASSGLILP
jgi:hypothetical protein